MSLPSNFVSVNGIGVISDDNMNTTVQWDSTVTQLKNFVGSPKMTTILQGTTASGDGGGGIFYWASGNFTDDGVSTIVPPAAVGKGAWLRLAIQASTDAFNPDDFTVTAGVVSLAATIKTAHTWTQDQTFSGGTITISNLLNAGTIDISTTTTTKELVVEDFITVNGTGPGIIAAGAAINILGGTLVVGTKLAVGGSFSNSSGSTSISSSTILATAGTEWQATGPNGVIFMGGSNTFSGDWEFTQDVTVDGTVTASAYETSGTLVPEIFVGSGSFLNAGTIHQGDTITQKPGTFALPFSWGGGTVSAQTIELGWAPQDLVITKMIGNLGTAGGSYAVAALNNGSTITGLGSLAINSTSTTSATASAGNTVTAGNPMSIIVSGLTSTPTGGAIQIQGTYTS